MSTAPGPSNKDPAAIANPPASANAHETPARASRDNSLLVLSCAPPPPAPLPADSCARASGRDVFHRERDWPPTQAAFRRLESAPGAPVHRPTPYPRFVDRVKAVLPPTSSSPVVQAKPGTPANVAPRNSAASDESLPMHALGTVLPHAQRIAHAHSEKIASVSRRTTGTLLRDAHSPRRPGHRHCVSLGRDGARRIFSPRPAQCRRLLSRWTLRAVVGTGLLHRGHGNFHPHHHRHASHLLRGKSRLPAAGLWLFARSFADRAALASGLFSRRILYRLCGN